MIDAPTPSAETVLGRLSGCLASLPRSRAALLSFGLGLLAVLALPPFYLVPVLVPAFCGLVWLLDRATDWRRSFLTGWCFAFGYFFAGLFWIGSAVLVVAEDFWWFLPVPVIGLPALLAAFFGAGIAVARRVCWQGPARILSLTTAWFGVEWLRSWIFTGFPWNQPGTAWVFSEAMLQFAALGGVWGLTLVTVIAAAAPATMADTGGRVRRWGLPGLAAALLAALWLGGSLRLAAAPAPGEATHESLNFRLVQPSIAQRDKWRPDLRSRHVLEMAALSREAGFEKVTHVVWPEMAFTYPLGRAPRATEALVTAVPAEGLLLTGLPRLATDSLGQTDVWNSLAAISAAGEPLASYDKEHLVPFGEYVPAVFDRLLGMAKLTHGRSDFSRGPGRQTLAIPGLPPVSPLICYEVIFPGAATAGGADWILNITNDAWFGETTGPYQHFAAARLRAVEEGVPLLRVANSGISAVVDAYGRVLQQLPLGARGVIDSPLPKPAQGRTPFSLIGGLLPLVLLGCLVILTKVVGQHT